jgi:hypothetical protein
MQRILAVLFAGLFLSCSILFAQDQVYQVLTLEQAIEKLEKSNLLLENSRLDAEAIRNNKSGWLPSDPVRLHFFYGNTNDTRNDYIFESHVPLGSIPSMLRYREHHRQEIKLAEILYRVDKLEMTKHLKTIYYQWLFADKKKLVLENFLEFFKQYHVFENLRNENLSDLQEMEFAMLLLGVENDIRMMEAEMRTHLSQISELLMQEEEWRPDHNTNEIYVIHFPEEKTEEFPGPGLLLDKWNENLKAAKAKANYEKASLFPSLFVGAFNQSIGGTPGFHGVYAGMSIPLWDWISGKQKRENELNISRANNQFTWQEFSLQKQLDELINQMDAQHFTLQYQYARVLPYAYELKKSTMERYLDEQISMEELFGNLQKVSMLDMSYLETLEKYNLLAIELEFMIL